MSKGAFDTPRSLGTVDEIVPLFVQVKLRSVPGMKFSVSANMAEGETPNPPPDDMFVVHKEETLALDIDSLTVAQKTTVARFLKLLVTKYVEAKGYENVTVS